MANDSYVQVPIDSTGKRVDASVLTTADGAVQRQRIVLGDDGDPAGLAKVQGVDPASTDLGLTVRPVTSPTLQPYRKVSVTGNNADVVKATSGVLYGWEIFSTAAYSIYVKLYDKAVAPDPTVDIPVLVIGVQAGTRSAQLSSLGLGGFTAGIAIAIVQGIADNNNIGVAQGDCVVNILSK